MYAFIHYWHIFKKGNRAQIDRKLYKKNMQETIFNTKNLSVMAQQVNDILLVEQPLQDDENKAKLKVAGVVLGKCVE